MFAIHSIKDKYVYYFSMHYGYNFHIHFRNLKMSDSEDDVPLAQIAAQKTVEYDTDEEFDDSDRDPDWTEPKKKKLKKYEHKQVTQKNTKKQTAPKKQQVVTKKKETNVKEMTKKMIEAILLDEVMDMIAIKEDIERISSPEYIASRIVEAVIDEAVNIGDLLVKKKKKKNAAIEKKRSITWVWNMIWVKEKWVLPEL